MKVISVLNMKGGVGKTTAAVHLAAGFAARGNAVLLIDGDPQGNVGHTFQVRRPQTLRELLLGEAAVEDVICRDVRPRLDVIVSTTEAFSLERQLAGVMQRETIMARRLRELSGYDVVIVDTSPAMNLITFNALLFSDAVMIPVGMDLMSVIGARQTLNGIAEVRELWPDRRLDVLAVVPMMVNSSTNATKATMEAIAGDGRLGPFLYERGIRQCLDLTYASASHQTIWEYSPRSRGAEDFAALLDFTEQALAVPQMAAAHGR